MKKSLALVVFLSTFALACDDATSLCTDAPVVTYENFGAGFIDGNCQPCHASGAADRQDAPENVTFDTLQDIQNRKERILARAAGNSPDMPPAGGVSEDDRELLEIWLSCWE